MEARGESNKNFNMPKSALPRKIYYKNEGEINILSDEETKKNKSSQQNYSYRINKVLQTGRR